MQISTQWITKKLIVSMAAGLLIVLFFSWLRTALGDLGARTAFAQDPTIVDRIGQGNGHSSALSLSADGTFYAFATEASDLLADDTNNASDIFIYNRNTDQINRASLTDGSEQANGGSYAPSLSANGRFVAFTSDATNLVLVDSNKARDIFVRDLISGQTERISRSTAGAQANGPSHAPSISGDGRYVVFSSDATDLVANDTNNSRDIFLHDRHTVTTRRISLDSTGIAGNRDSFLPTISADGRAVVYESLANNLVPNDTNRASDIFLYDVGAGTTRRVSVGYGGQGNGPSTHATISATGGYVAFRSFANMMIPNDTNNTWDVFVLDLARFTLERVSIATDGSAGNAQFANSDVLPTRPALSGDGRYVLFQSDATNLVADDTNAQMDVFIRDRVERTTVRISVSKSGEEADRHAFAPVFSDDGRFVAFLSAATTLVPEPSTDFIALFYRDRAPVWPTPTSTATATQTPLPTATFTATPTATPLVETATPTATPITPTPDSPLGHYHLMLPMLIAQVRAGSVLALEPIQQYANTYSVRWIGTATTNVEYTLEEATSESFADATVVYRGVNTLWQAQNKQPGRYFYRVKQRMDTLESGWAGPRAVQIYPLFVGMDLRWQGTGSIQEQGQVTELGYSWSEALFGLEGAAIQSRGYQGYAPNPKNWPEEHWLSTYDVTTGVFLSSTLPPDAKQRWGYPWILPYAVTLDHNVPVLIDNQVFLVTGPHAGTSAFGMPMNYWRLLNRDRFLYADDGAGRQEFVEPGDVEIWYDGGRSRLLMRHSVVRRVYQSGQNTGDLTRYTVNLIESNSLPQ